jgi:hypothetical protein
VEPEGQDASRRIEADSEKDRPRQKPEKEAPQGGALYTARNEGALHEVFTSSVVTPGSSPNSTTHVRDDK